MKTRVLLRSVHHWISPLILLPLGVVICTGLLLMLKKDFDWLQPPTQKGEQPAIVPAQSFAQLFERAQQVPQLDVTEWTDLTRVDVKPGKGVIKFVSRNQWEAQMDAHTGEVLQVAYRRSDFIESLHDGSFFADWTQKAVFLPTGILLLILWGSGIYLFVITQAARRRKSRKRKHL